MGRLRSILLDLALMAGSVIFTLLLMEAVLRFLPVAWAPPVEPPSAADPIQRYVANAPFTWSIGWDFSTVVHGRTNAQGFVADYDYDAAATVPLLAVLGDSYVEAMMVPFAESITGRLQKLMGTRGRVYAIAQSGSPLSQYMAYARHACAVYRPERVVIVIVGNDFDESLYAHGARDGIHHLHPRPDGRLDLMLTPLPPPGFVERTARNSALALYLMRNVKIGGLLREFGFSKAQAAPDAYVGNTLADASAARVAEGERVIDWFLRELPAAACLAAKDITLLVDASRPQLYDAAQLAATRGTYFDRLRSSLLAKGAAAGFKAIDMEQRFRDDYARRGKRFEFSGDGHWNAEGHAVAAQAVRDALADWPAIAP